MLSDERLASPPIRTDASAASICPNGQVQPSATLSGAKRKRVGCNQCWAAGRFRAYGVLRHSAIATSGAAATTYSAHDWNSSVSRTVIVLSLLLPWADFLSLALLNSRIICSKGFLVE